MAVRASGGSAEARADADFLLAFKERDFVDALLRAADVVVDPLASRETVVQGTTVDVTVRTFLPDRSAVKVQGDVGESAERLDRQPASRARRQRPARDLAGANRRPLRRRIA